MAAGTIGLKAVFTADDKITSSVIRMQSAVIGFTDSASKGLGKLDAVNDKVWGGFKTAGIALGGLGLGAASVAKSVIDAGADFEQAIANVGAVSLMTRAEIAPLEALAKKLGATTQFSATQVAGAMETMGKAGYTNAEIMAGVGGMLAAAAADGADLAETTGTVSNVLKGMGLAAGDTSRVADVLALASARTNSSIASLGQSMANVSSTARQLGIPLEDTVAMVAMLQDVGLDASEAGSALSTMLTKLAAPSKDAAQQMAAMGVKFQDSAGNMLAPAKVLEQLVKAGEKSGGNMKQVAFFADLVGMRGQKAALNLKDLFKTGKVGGLTDELYKFHGAAGKMASIRMDTFKGDIETLGGSIDSLKISLFDMQSGPLRGVVQDMTKWLDANSGLIVSGIGDKIKEWTPLVIAFGQGLRDGFAGAAPVIQGVTSSLSWLFGNASSDARENARGWGEDIAKWGIRWVEFSIGLKAARFAMWGFGNATKIARGAIIAYEATVGFVKGTMALYNSVTAIGSANTIAFASALQGATTGAGSAAESTGKLASSVGEAASGAGRLAGMRGAINDTFDSWGAKAGLAAAAIGAVTLAYQQAAAFGNENGGWEGFKGFVGLSDKTNAWGFQGINDVMDDQARAEREAGPNGSWAKSMPASVANPIAARAYDRIGLPGLRQQFPAAPGGYAAAFGVGAPATGPGMAPPPTAPAPAPPAPGVTPEALRAAVKNSLEVTVKSTDGTTAEVTKKPAGTQVNLQPSGAP